MCIHVLLGNMSTVNSVIASYFVRYEGIITCVHTHTHTHTHTGIHKHTHTHTHTQVLTHGTRFSGTIVNSP